MSTFATLSDLNNVVNNLNSNIINCDNNLNANLVGTAKNLQENQGLLAKKINSNTDTLTSSKFDINNIVDIMFDALVNKSDIFYVREHLFSKLPDLSILTPKELARLQIQLMDRVNKVNNDVTVGYKAGATDPDLRLTLNLPDIILGLLPSRSLIPSGSSIQTKGYFPVGTSSARWECEFLFRVNNLTQKEYTVDNIIPHIQGIGLGYEIINVFFGLNTESNQYLLPLSNSVYKYLVQGDYIPLTPTILSKIVTQELNVVNSIYNKSDDSFVDQITKTGKGESVEGSPLIALVKTINKLFTDGYDVDSNLTYTLATGTWCGLNKFKMDPGPTDTTLLYYNYVVCDASDLFDVPYTISFTIY